VCVWGEGLRGDICAREGCGQLGAALVLTVDAMWGRLRGWARMSFVGAVRGGGIYRVNFSVRLEYYLWQAGPGSGGARVAAKG
jgi:hypothetical protein